jgi:hypothetical protein
MAPSVQWVRTTVGYVNAGHIISAQIQKTGAYLLHLIDGREAETCHGACFWEADGPHQDGDQIRTADESDQMNDDLLRITDEPWDHDPAVVTFADDEQEL